MSCRFVAQSTRPKMHANPDPVLLVREKIDIMISAANGAELFGRHRFQIADRFDLPRRIFEQFVFDTRFAFASDPERNVSYYVVHDFVDLGREFFAFRVGQNCQIAAGDVEPDAAQRDFIFVSDNAANRLRVTLMAIGAKHAALTAGRDTGFDLLDRRSVVLPENLRRSAHAVTYR